MTDHTQPSENLQEHSETINPPMHEQPESSEKSRRHDEHEGSHPLTDTLAAVVGGGVAGATLGKAIGGRTGATIGAVVGGIVGAAINKDAGKQASHTINIATDVVQEFAQGAEHSSETPNDAEPSNDIAEHISEQRVSPDRSVSLETSSNSPEPETLAKTHYQIGVSLGRQGRMEEAIEEFQEALDFAPESAETHYNLGVALDKQGEVEQALEHIQQAKELCEEQGKTQAVQFVEQVIETIEDRQHEAPQ